MRVGLRWKIMVFTVLPLVGLAFAALSIVDRTTTKRVNQEISEDLDRASAVLENALAESERSLVVTVKVIVRDPKFFSVLTIPGSHTDPQLRATIGGVARDFNTATQADLFEITDTRGRLLASVGRDVSSEDSREPLVRAALEGQPVTRVMAQPGSHDLVCAAPAIAGGRVVGILLLGTRIGSDLADRLRRLTRSDVTFISGAIITGTSLERGGDREALLRALPDIRVPRTPANAGDPPALVRGVEHQYLTIVRLLPRSDPMPAQTYVMQRARDTETAFLRSIQTGLVGLGIVSVLAALLAGFLIAQRITAPVQRLVRGAEEMERGNFDYPLGVRSHDEIGTLASSFDGMRRRQREYIRTLKEADRIKTEFINVASHELRTPVTIIRGYQEMMAQSALGPLTPQQQRAVEATLKSCDTLVRIAEDATRVAQIESNHLELRFAELDVMGLVGEAVAMARSAGKDRSVEVVSTVPAGIGTASVDRTLAQALANLVSNGIRFTPDGGRVDVEARRDGAWLSVSVRDTGVGMTAEQQADVFNRASVLRDSRHHHSSSTLEFNSAGLGLGLSIARGIVEAHGGKLTVESAPGKGSTFVMRVPAVPAHAMARAA
jgi:signal transduction histidine kinase